MSKDIVMEKKMGVEDNLGLVKKVSTRVFHGCCCMGRTESPHPLSAQQQASSSQQIVERGNNPARGKEGRGGKQGHA